MRNDKGLTIAIMAAAAIGASSHYQPGFVLENSPWQPRGKRRKRTAGSSYNKQGGSDRKVAKAAKKARRLNRRK